MLSNFTDCLYLVIGIYRKKRGERPSGIYWSTADAQNQRIAIQEETKN
ncbi:2679_t:CDS:1, partial [Acaulospora colombiana]